ncbi:MAG: nuclear transport factor 2 family protein [Myxococcota bacterium]
MSATIRDRIHQLFDAVDARRFDDARAVMTETIEVNYADLGGATGPVPADELVAGWAAFLPHFDRTKHQLTEPVVNVVGDRATATFDGIAVHVLTEQGKTASWTVFAGYDAEFVTEAGAWKLARLHLSLYAQTGDLELPARAGDHSPVALAEPNSSPSVEAFFDALEGNDLNGLAKALAPDVTQTMPLAPAGFPKEVDGREALLDLYRNVIQHPQRYPRTTLPTADPRIVLVAFQGEVTLAEGVYANRYVSLFKLDPNGQIQQIVEHFHPDVLLASWPGLQPAHHSVHASGAPTRDVTVEEVRFERDGMTLVGHLFRPVGDATALRPAVVVTGSWTSVKEQMPDVYASRLAARGLVTLTFDFTGFGASDGRRQHEEPQRKIADIRAAVAFLATQPGVDPNAIGGLGICASAGYMAHAAVDNDQLSRVALVAPWLHDETMARGIYDLRPMHAEGLLAAADQAEAHYEATGESTMVLAASELDPASAMYVPGDIFDYYLNPAKGAGNHYDNRFDVASWRPWITFDGISASQGLRGKPVRVVHTEQGAVPEGAKRFVSELGDSATSTWLNAYTQQDFYYVDPAVTAALDEITPFLR